MKMKCNTPWGVMTYLAISGVLLVLLVANFRSHIRPVSRQPKQEVVVANTWGWATLKSAPVPVGYRQAPGSHDNIGLLQVEFEMNSGVWLTALVNATQMERKISPATNNWSKGDQVMVVCVSSLRRGVGDVTVPSVTYFVIDYCPQK